METLSNRIKSIDFSRREILIGLAAINLLAPNLVMAQNSHNNKFAEKTSQMNLAQMLLHSTILIRCMSATGENSAGTGFILSLFEKDQQHVIGIVTNKHVIDGASIGTLKFTLTKPDGSADIGKSTEIAIDNFSNRWIRHPSQDVDLAFLPIGPYIQQFESQSIKPFFIPLNLSLVPTDDVFKGLTPLEEVLIVGYPDGISDNVNNLPIFRRGITATSSNINFDGKPQFLIDAAIFPGSSGSPTLIFNQGSYSSPDGGIILGGRIILIGIVFAVALHTSNGEIKIVPAPTQSKSIVQTQIPNNLGICVSSQRLLDFEPILVGAGFVPPQDYVMRVQKPYI